MKVKSESEVTQSYLTLRDPMDCSLPGSSIHGIFQAREPEWGAIAFSNRECYQVIILRVADKMIRKTGLILIFMDLIVWQPLFSVGF